MIKLLRELKTFIATRQPDLFGPIKLVRGAKYSATLLRTEKSNLSHKKLMMRAGDHQEVATL